MTTPTTTNPPQPDFATGQVLLLDKPLHWTSFNVVAKVRNTIRRHAGRKIKVGHAGTLDPLATGLLILCTGKMTKQIETFQGQEKEYTGTFRLGEQTPSYDRETEVNKVRPIAHLREAQLREAAQRFTGWIEQQPPVFSAVRVKGKRAYEHARKGEAVAMKTRQVEIKTFEILRVAGAEVDFRVVCSKGTYIRSLAHDFGQHLEVGAHLSALRRTRIGAFTVTKALTPEAWVASLEGIA